MVDFIPVPVSVFMQLSKRNVPDILNDAYNRQEFVKTFRHFLYHRDMKSLGIDAQRFEKIFGASVGERSWMRQTEEYVDDSIDVMQKLSIAHLIVAHASRIFRSNELLQEAFLNVSSIEEAIKRILPENTIPNFASLVGFSHFIDSKLAIQNENPNRVRHGTLEPFFETGTEGVIWSMDEDLGLSYDSLYPLENGDHLQVFDKKGNLFWSGHIKLEYSRNKVSQGGIKQQAIRGFWVHGFNASQTPEEWADMFYDRLHARLVKKKSREHLALTITSYK